MADISRGLPITQPEARNPDLCAAWAPGRGRVGGMLLLVLLACCAGNRAGAVDSTGDSAKPGVAFKYDNNRIQTVPWSVHVARMDLRSDEMEVHAMLARGTVLGLAPVTAQVRALPSDWGTPLAAVNGDFYERENSPYAGDPRGLEIVEGELVSAPTAGAAFWIDAAGKPAAGKVTSQLQVIWPQGASFGFGLNEARRPNSMVLYTPTLGPSTLTRGGRELVLEKAEGSPWLPLRAGETYTAKVREIREQGNTRIEPNVMILSLDPQLATNTPATAVGTLLKLSIATQPSLAGARAAIGGGSIITHDGKRLDIEKPKAMQAMQNYSIRSMFERHPRSAVGWSKTHLFLVQVDGRQPGLSMGMTLAELGDYMASLGCDEAMNLDGGGSATFWHRGRVVNSPCDGTERPVANGLVILRKSKR